ncbi:2OG-Fe dioxygenase family protein [Qaidamihabitans albus]|uniref:2OG-Fe dioxygenase family protein n=1 Tax=Qaidamihabitans albus TaxID=2795733 RepID=UPI0018F1F6B9|nr:2OG-Fe dioxygenase family protein [Qaidamihabitans albus]
MTDESLAEDRRRLLNTGYAVLNEKEFGFSLEGREHLRRKFFHDGVLRSYLGDLPADRKRARDVVRFEWHGDDVRLDEHDTITIENRGERPEPREYGRVRVLADPVFEQWIRSVLALVPVPWRDRRGTFGVNLFRTFTNVVTKPHQDGERIIFIYVLDKVGSGAETRLYETAEAAVPVCRSTLEPGDLLVFEDNRFWHNVTPLEPAPDGAARRDALVCTVNYEHTYPPREWRREF